MPSSPDSSTPHSRPKETSTSPRSRTLGAGLTAGGLSGACLSLAAGFTVAALYLHHSNVETLAVRFGVDTYLRVEVSRALARAEEVRFPDDEAYRCRECGHRWYYTRGRCPACRHDAADTYRFGLGELVAVTEVAVTPPDVRSPNWLGVARFDGVGVLGQLVTRRRWATECGSAGNRLREDDEQRQPRLRVVEADGQE